MAAPAFVAKQFLLRKHHQFGYLSAIRRTLLMTPDQRKSRAGLWTKWREARPTGQNNDLQNRIYRRRGFWNIKFTGKMTLATPCSGQENYLSYYYWLATLYCNKKFVLGGGRTFPCVQVQLDVFSSFPRRARKQCTVGKLTTFILLIMPKTQLCWDDMSNW